MRLRWEGGKLTQRREPVLHLTNRVLHVEAGMVLSVEFGIDGGDFGTESGQCGAALAVGELRTDAMPRGPQFLNTAEQAMDGPQLSLHLGEEIQLVSRDDFGLALK
jgi:hypothetical protein